MFTALTATRTKVTHSEPGADARTYVNLAWGDDHNPWSGDFISTSYEGHLTRADAIARAVADMNALDVL